MLDRLLASILKEFLIFWRDPRSRGMLLAVPVIQVIIFGFAASLEVRNVDLAILNEDAGRWSRDLVQRVSNAEFVQSAVYLDNLAQVSDTIDARKILLALHFPADFSRNIVAGESARVQLIVDGRRANAGQIATSYLRAIVGGWAQGLPSGTATLISPPQAELRHWFNPNLNYRWFIVPSLAGTMSMMIALMMTGMSISRERELGTFDQLLVSPSTPLEIMISKIIPALLVAGVVATLIICLAVFGFGVPLYGNAVTLLAAMFPFAFAIAGIGLFISAFAYTQQQALLASFFVMMPLVLTSGFITPIDNMPTFLQYLTIANPLKYCLIIIQGSFLKSMPLADILANIWPLLIIGTITFTMATIAVRRRLQ